MTDDEIVALGSFCAELKADERFQVLLSLFEKNIIDHMLHTEPHEQKKREGIYASALGVRDFLGNMNAIIDQRDKLVAPPAPSEDDALADDLD